MNEYGCSVVVVSGQESDGSAMGLREVWRLASVSQDQPRDSRTETLESLVLVDAGRWLGHQSCNERRWTANRPEWPVSKASETIEEESRCDRYLQRIWSDLAEALEHTRRAEPSLIGKRCSISWVSGPGRTTT